MFRKMLMVVFSAMVLLAAAQNSAEAHGWGHHGIGHHYGWGGNYGWSSGYRYGGWGGYGLGYRPAFYSPVVSYYRPIAYYRPVVSYYRPRIFSYYAPGYFNSYYSYPSYPSCNVYYSQPCCASNYTPTYYPAQAAYGPQANQQFWGLSSNTVPTNNGNNVVSTVAMILKTLQTSQQNQPASQPQFINNSKQPSLPIARSRARSMMAVGDRYFREQKYSDAATKYREATTAAPDLAEGYFRMGHAYSAMGRVEAAASAFRRAVAISTDIKREGFRLDDLYANSQIAKRSHIESIAAAALEAPGQSDHLLVVGMFLHYDGQPERAVKFLHRSTELGENAQDLVAYWNSLNKPAANTVLQVKANIDEI